MFHFLGRKGQEEAPFELLIAVIIMGFVLFIGLKAMTTLDEQRCSQQTEQKLEDLKTKLEIVINQKSPQFLDFRADCYDPKDETIKISYSERPQVCADYCSSGASICRLLEYSNSKKGVYFKKCLNINPNTVFSSPDCPDLQASEKKILLEEFVDIVPRGVIYFNNKETSASFPTVCAYCREDSGSCAG
ncbi:MAG: hypothetical protein PHD95_05665 [Candidatus ainarchaeum sp.]|nr:hypothetical protein [Candidatus ainarchaeum sp.]